MRVLGLTGNFGCGKSTVAAMFQETGIPVVDADRISRQVTAAGSPVYREIVRAFGEEILLPDGAIDRRRLGELVFADAQHRTRLEAITHPAILEALREALAVLARDGHRVALVEAALIHESGRKGLIGEVISVRCDGEVQLRRVTARDGISTAQAADRIRAQMDPGDKERRSDYVIDNSGSMEETRRQVEQLAQTLRRRD
ncbi:MAG: dephospho-CoA kinase [Verrucomicrobiota bacterium]